VTQLVLLPDADTWRDILQPCGCVKRCRWRLGGWLGYTRTVCRERAAGKSCSAVRGGA